MYSNIPTNELTKIIDLMYNQHYIKEELKHETMKISQILIKTTFSFKIRLLLAHQLNLCILKYSTIHGKYEDIRHFIRTSYNGIFPLC